jgi:hypothetical protein
VFERYIDNNIEQVTCECGGLADRIIGMPRVSLDGTDPGFPGAYEKWAKTREDNARIKSKRSYHGE